jgi:hypothetical protein
MPNRLLAPSPANSSDTMMSMSIVMNAQKVERVARGYLGTWLELALLRKPRAAAPVQA